MIRHELYGGAIISAWPGKSALKDFACKFFFADVN